MNPTLNYNCQLEVKISEATFLKDEDALGKQDPFVQFSYDGFAFRTSVKDDAGLHAAFNETFLLENVEGVVKAGQDLVMEAMDSDVGSGDDLLGKANALTFVKLVADD